MLGKRFYTVSKFIFRLVAVAETTVIILAALEHADLWIIAAYALALAFALYCLNDATKALAKIVAAETAAATKEKL